MHIKEKVLKVQWKYKAFKEKKQSANLIMSRVNGECLMAIAGNTYLLHFFTQFAERKNCLKTRQKQATSLKTDKITHENREKNWKTGKNMKTGYAQTLLFIVALFFCTLMHSVTLGICLCSFELR